METKTFAFIVEGEVFEMIDLNSSMVSYPKYVECLSSNPVGIDITDHPSAWIDWKFENGEWSPLEGAKVDEYFEPGTERFAFLHNNVIKFAFRTKIGSPKAEMLKSAFASNPTAVECTGLSVKIGSIWDGSSFTDPA